MKAMISQPMAGNNTIFYITMGIYMARRIPQYSFMVSFQVS